MAAGDLVPIGEQIGVRCIEGEEDLAAEAVAAAAQAHPEGEEGSDHRHGRERLQRTRRELTDLGRLGSDRIPNEPVQAVGLVGAEPTRDREAFLLALILFLGVKRSERAHRKQCPASGLPLQREGRRSATLCW